MNASDAPPPGDLCVRVTGVVDNIVSHRFITDMSSKKLSYTNAGHCPPNVVRDGVAMRWWASLGIFPVTRLI